MHIYAARPGKKIHSNQLFEIEKVLLCGKVSLNLIQDSRFLFVTYTII